MATFPTTFAEQAATLEPGIGERGNAALDRLREKGYSVATRLTKYYAGAVGLMGAQRHIREYCPRDATLARFGSLASTEKWLQKGGGRGMFLLLRGIGPDAQLEGYG